MKLLVLFDRFLVEELFVVAGCVALFGEEGEFLLDFL